MLVLKSDKLENFVYYSIACIMNKDYDKAVEIWDSLIEIVNAENERKDSKKGPAFNRM